MYGIELIILISGALGCALAAWPMGSLSIVGSLTIWRFFLGVGVGGDYPVSAVLASEFGNSKNRGAMIATVFAMQGLGILTGAVASIITLAAFKQSILANGASELEYVWRILAGFGAVPAFAAVYFRLTIPESPRYAIDVLNDQTRASEATNAYLERSDLSRVNAIDGILLLIKPVNRQVLLLLHTSLHLRHTFQSGLI